MNGEKKIVLLGGGGHCKSVLDCLLSLKEYDRIGIVDRNKSASVLGVAVIGTDDDLLELKEEGWTDAFITVGSIGTTSIRRKLYERIKSIGFVVPTIIAPSADIARGVTIKEGTFVGKRVVINTGSSIGFCAIINTAATIEHECTIGDFSHISSGDTLCGQVTVGANSHVGAGSIIRQGITVGRSSLIGIGSIVVKDIPDDVKAYGNPCKVVGVNWSKEQSI